MNSNVPVDAASVGVPSLEFQENPDVVRGYDKYFYFWRENTDFNAALYDIKECDAFARGMAFRLGDGGEGYDIYSVQSPAMQMAGAIVSIPMSFMMDRIMAAPKRRGAHRVNLRVCMGYKGYHRYGLPKAVWETFNFDEATKEVDEAPRQRMLMQQAKIASGPQPQKPELK